MKPLSQIWLQRKPLDRRLVVEVLQEEISDEKMKNIMDEINEN